MRLWEQENASGRPSPASCCSSFYQYELYSALQSSTDQTLAAIADKALKEVEYHQDHAAQWILRLGLGTEESKRRIQDGLYYMWPYLDELFADEPLHDELEGVAARPSMLRERTMDRVTALLAEAELEVPNVAQARLSATPRDGAYSELPRYILAEMQWLARQHPAPRGELRVLPCSTPLAAAHRRRGAPRGAPGPSRRPDDPRDAALWDVAATV